METSIFRAMLLASVSVTAAVGIAPVAAQAQEQSYDIDVPAQSLGDAIRALGRATRQTIVFDGSTVRGKRSAAVRGRMTPGEALKRMLAGSNLVMAKTSSGSLTVRLGNGQGGAEPASLSGRRATVKSGNGPDTGRVSSPEEGDIGRASESEIVVTGSHIRGASPSGSPLRTYSQADIQSSGRATLEGFLETIPSNFSNVGSDSLQRTAPGTGATGHDIGINLRGLGPQATLVLLNGHRLAPSPLGGRFTDISAIPANMIDRIEVLTDGGSSIYGSDAVAGVVNFILKKNFTGGETRVTSTFDTRGSANSFEASQIFGTTWQSGGVIVGGNYRNQNGLKSTARAYTSGTDVFSLSPDTESGSFTASGHQDISPDISVSGDFLFQKQKTDFVHNLVGAFQYPQRLRTQQYLGSLSVDGQISETWRARLTASRGEGTVDLTNLFGARESTVDMTTFDAVADGSIFDLPAGQVKLAIGAQRRDESINATSRGAFTQKVITSRHVNSLFGELSIPVFGTENASRLLQELSFSASLRYEDYGQNVGSKLSPRVGGEWSPTNGVRVRGSFSESFRAPQFSDLASAAYVYLQNSTDPTSPTGVTPVLRLDGSNPNLSPETSKSFTFGLALEPVALPGLSLDLNYFNISYRNRVASPRLPYYTELTTARSLQFVTKGVPQSTILAIYSDPAVLSYNDTTRVGPLASLSQASIVVDNRVRNLARTDTSGLDVSAVYKSSLGSGTLSLGLNGTYIFNLDDTLFAGDPKISNLNVVDGPTTINASAFVGFTSDRFSGRVSAAYVGGYDGPGANVRVPAWVTADLFLQYVIGASAKPFSISLSVRNVFDRDPPFVALSNAGGGILGFDPSHADPYGRVISVGVAKHW